MILMIKDNTNAVRKAYAKPLIAIENFTLNQFIATCAVKTRGKTKEEWMEDLLAYSPFHYATIDNTGQFADPVGCVVNADADMDTLCYHTSTSPLFTS